MYRVEVANSGGFLFTSASPGGTVAIDMHGVAGITPPDCLLASVASCIGVYLRKYAEGAKLDISGFKVRAEGELVKDGALAFRLIKVTIDLGGAVLEERRRAALLEFVRNCPVHNTLHANPAVEISIS
jgi:putative redox protein